MGRSAVLGAPDWTASVHGQQGQQAGPAPGLGAGELREAGFAWGLQGRPPDAWESGQRSRGLLATPRKASAWGWLSAPLLLFDTPIKDMEQGLEGQGHCFGESILTARAAVSVDRV